VRSTSLEQTPDYEWRSTVQPLYFQYKSSTVRLWSSVDQIPVFTGYRPGERVRFVCSGPRL